MPGKWSVMMDEALAKRVEYESASKTRAFLETLLTLPNGRSGLKRELRRVMDAHGVNHDRFNSYTLGKVYDEITYELNRLYGHPEARRTAPERHFAEVFGRISKKQLIPAFWIGNLCVDYFCPSIRVNECVGVAFEIDGSIHLKPFKQRKDDYKDDRLLELGIWTKHIDNEDVDHPTVRIDLESMCSLKPADSKSVKCQKNQIYIHTLAIHAWRWHFHLLCGISADLLNELVSVYERRRGGMVTFRDTLELPDTIMAFPCFAGGKEHQNLHQLQDALIEYLAEVEFETECRDHRNDKWHGLVKRMLHNWVDVKIHNKPSYETYREALLTLGENRDELRVKTRPI